MPDAGSTLESHAAVLAAPRTVPRARRRILVTGAGGMLGSDLVVLLISAGYDVLARSRTDLDVADIKALLLGYQAMLRYRADPAATERLTAMIHAGLQPPRAE